VDSLTQEAYLREQKDMTRMTVAVAIADLTDIQHQLKEVAPHSKRESPTSSFKLVEDTTMIEVDLKIPARLSALGLFTSRVGSIPHGVSMLMVQPL
jgi:hypothetical protein